MSSSSISNNFKHKLPNKKVFLTFIIVLISLTFGAMVALANENTVVVEADVLNVRYGPGLSHDTLTQAEENDRLFLLGEENKWFKVRLENDQVGWVASWLVDSNELIQEDQQFARVTGESVNIRQFSNTDSQILGTVYRDTELQVLYQDGSWYQVLYMGQVAWIHGDYIEMINTTPAEDVQTTSESVSDSVVVIGDAPSTNIRSQPSMNGEVIATSDPGQQYNYIDSIGDWFHIQIDENTTAYVASSVASISSQDDVAETEAASIDTTEAQSARTATNLAEAIIVIDAGHGGYDSGAISNNNAILEKDVTLSTAQLLQNRLQDAGSNVILTRSSDQYISLDGRVQTAHANNADLFISLHYDAVEVANSMSGTTTYYHSEENLDLANTVNRYLSQNGPLTNNGIRLGDYYVLRTNRQPSILLELGYMNNTTDIQYIDTQSYQATIVEAIYQALRDYYGQ